MKKINQITLILIVFILLLTPLKCIFAEEWQQVTISNPLNQWTVLFNLEVNPDTININNFIVYYDNFIKHPIDIKLLDDGKSVLIEPLSEYQHGKIYYLMITTDVLYQNDKALKQDIKMPFYIDSYTVPSIGVEISESIIKSGEKTTIYFTLNNHNKPEYIDIELDSPPGNTYSGVRAQVKEHLNKDENGRWFVDIPTPYNALEGRWIISNISITYDDESETNLIYGKDHNLEFEVIQSNEGIPMNVEISFASDNLNIKDVILNKKELSEYEDTLSVNLGQRVPQGIYNIQVKASDDSNNYILFKRDYDFNSETNTITFSKDEVSNLTIDMENNDLELRGLILSPENWRSFNMTPLYIYNSSKSVYISKMEYESAWTSFYTYDRYELHYKTIDINGYKDTTLKFSTNIDANLNFENKSTYSTGEKIKYYNDFLVLKDDVNNQILFATDPEYNHINGSLIFTNETQTFRVPIEKNLLYPEVTLPSDRGTFNVIYENNDIPGQVTSNQQSIKIK